MSINRSIRKKDTVEAVDLTPKLAVFYLCRECVGWEEKLEKCGGDKMLDGTVCAFWPYRLGQGRPSVKLIRAYCLECMGKSREAVARCASEFCPLYPYRFGTNPEREGKGGAGFLKNRC